MRKIIFLLPFLLWLPAFAQKHLADGDRVIRGNRLISGKSIPGQQLLQQKAYFTKREIQVDAKMLEDDWMKAQIISPFLDNLGRAEKTSVRVLFDSTNIYLFWNINEKNGITAQAKKTDSLLTTDDYLQVNLKPLLADSIQYARDYYYSIAVNPLGTTWDAYFDPYLGGYLFSSWTSQAQISVQKNGKKWSAEMIIPFSGLDNSSNPGWKWNLNFSHHSQISPKKDVTYRPELGVTVEQGIMVRRPAMVQYYWTRPDFMQEVKPAKQEQAKQSVRAVHIAKVPQVNGSQDDTLWNSTNEIQISFDDRTGMNLKSNTASARVAWTSGQLCFSLRAHGAKIKKHEKEKAVPGKGMRGQMTGVNGVFRDDALFANESFWLLLQPRDPHADNVHQNYYLIIVNNSGKMTSISYDRFGTPDRNWNPQAKIDIFNTPSGWGAEVSVDAASFNLPLGCGTTWGLNIFRTLKQESQLQAWAPTGDDFLNPVKMGLLKNVQVANSNAVRSGLQREIAKLRNKITSSVFAYKKQTSRILQKIDATKLDSKAEMVTAENSLQHIDQALGIADAEKYFNAVSHPAKGGYALLDVQFIGKNGWAVGAMGTALYSRDGGKTWQRAQIQTDADLYRVFFVNENEGWAAGGRIRMGRTNEEMRHDQRGGYGYIFHTIDGGRTWKCQYGQRGRHIFGLYFVNSRKGFACGELGFLLKTDDGGLHWNLMPTTGTPRWLYGISFTDESNGFIVGESETVLKTTDGGATWMPLPVQADKKFYGFKPFYRDIHFSGSTCCIVGQNGTVIVSNDRGASWHPAATFFTDATREFMDLTRVHFISSQKGYAVGELGTRLLITEDSGKSWTLRPLPNTDWLRGVWANEDNVVLVGEREKILLSRDNGFSWKTAYGNIPKTDALVMMAHGDDAPINLGAFYANYAMNEKKNIVDIEVLRDAHSVEYKGEIYNLEHHRDIRMSGVRTTTYFDEFENGNNGADYYHFTERLWHGEKNVIRHMVAAIRAYRPDVIIIHGGVFGDYDKPGHKLSGRAGIPAFETAGGDVDQWPELTRLGLPPWQPKKLYCRASESYPMTLDLASIGRIPLKGTDGTCHDWAEYVIRNFQSQGVYHTRDGKLCLIKSLVPVPKRETSVFDGLK